MKYTLLSLWLLTTLSSCATVRVVKTRPGRGGELAIKEGILGEPGTIKAGRIMHTVCPRGFIVMETGETYVQLASESNHNLEEQNWNAFGPSADQHQFSGSTEKLEWRVKYRCKPLKIRNPRSVGR